MIGSLAKERIYLFLGSLPRGGPTNMDRTNANTVTGFDWFYCYVSETVRFNNLIPSFFGALFNSHRHSQLFWKHPPLVLVAEVTGDGDGGTVRRCELPIIPVSTLGERPT